MAKVFIGWEHGHGMGHAAMLVPIAKQLLEQGHTPVLALKDLETTRPLHKGLACEVIQAPIWPKREQRKKHDIKTIGEVLYHVGYEDTFQLQENARAWQSLVKQYKPDVIMAEYAPTLGVACIGGGIPYITVGTGHSTPPAGQELPPIRQWETAVPEPCRAMEMAVLSAMNAVRFTLKLPVFTYLSDAFGGDYTYVITYPELDNYAAYRNQPAIGPVARPQQPVFIKRDMPKDPKAFLYLAAPTKDFETILKSIDNANIACDIFVRNQESIIVEYYKNITFHKEPQPLDSLLNERAVLVHHAGMATTNQALAIGIPQLVLPTQLEQQATATSIIEAKCGIGFATKQRIDNPSLVTKALRTLVERKEVWQRAQTIAEDIESRYQNKEHHPLSILTQTIEAL